MMVVGRAVCGVGIAVVSTSAPLYQRYVSRRPPRREPRIDGCSEISPAKERGKFVAMNHVGFVVGLAVGLWYVPHLRPAPSTDVARVGYGMTFWTGSAGDYYGWRVSILLQLLPALTFAAGLPFTPES